MTPEEFQSDLTVRPEVIGTPSLLVHFLQNTSSQRALMQANAIVQAEVISGCECARIQTGFETKYGKYQFDASSRDQDIQILAVIPKFEINIKNDQVRNNPTITVIYLGSDDNRIGYFDVNSYTLLHKGFGYINKKMNQFQLQPGDFVPKDVKFITAPNHDDRIYNLGTQANVCYLPMWDTTDDAFVISKSLAKKCDHTVIDEVIINIKPESMPLNLYGDDQNYRCMPDIGEKVRDDGIIMAFRQKNEQSFLTDLTAKALCRPEYLHDDIFKTMGGAEIIDIQVFTNNRIYPNLDAVGPFGQLVHYQDQHNKYYAKIIDEYERLKKEGYKCRPEFTNLVTKCKGWCYTRGNGRTMILMDKKEPIDFIRVKVTYAYTQHVSIGSKLTGLDGSKGVVSAIWEDEDMPVGPNGVRADMLITGESPFNRLNSGQLTEQFINYASEVVAGRIAMKQIPEKDAYKYAIDYIREIRPVYADYIEQNLTTPELKEEFVEAIKENGFYFVIPSFSKAITPDMFLRIAKKYGVDQGHFTYNRVNPDGTKTKITTKCKGIVGGKYIYLLGKRPIDQLSVVEFGHVNQFMTPKKPNSKLVKAECIHGQTPMRYGEDEVANLTSIIGATPTARLTGLYSNSPTALRKLHNCLLTNPHPSALLNIGMSTKEIIETSSNIAMFKHLFAEIGYELKEQVVEVEEKANAN